MSGAGVQKNAKKLRHGANINRPNGCADFTASGDPRALIAAAAMGNRATRREALRSIKDFLKKHGAKSGK